MAAELLEFPKRQELYYSCVCGHSEFEAISTTPPKITSLVCKACAHIHYLIDGFVSE